MTGSGKRITRIPRKAQRRIGSLLGRLNGQSRVSQKRASWDRRWGDDTYRPAFELNQADESVRKALDDGWFSPDMRAVDIGCGAGYNAAWLAEHGLEAVGIDFSSEAVERARTEFSGTPNLSFEVVDVTESHGYEETFDALVDRGCIHGIDERYQQAYLDNLEMWARPGSRFLLIWRNKAQSSEHVVANAESMLARSFALVSAESVDIGGTYTDQPLPAMAMRFVRAT